MMTPSSAASFMHSRFCAAAVRNMALLLTLPWNCDMTRYVPSFFDEASPARAPVQFFSTHHNSCRLARGSSLDKAWLC